ncbi:hypothetical protein A3709_16785 [Halioglobus sp. HI00S01]|uniref:NERD domain-containing protein n=1 Tax=Halioglobus sp. HI00S01 TaxID=1822214 RepID=UPI0007C29B88|nr:NERD domain-containing protein [Halioglobus sp. HI00S01]KZX59198.1 hypothetical protein A3709_16785 [Halioglobus sp. HI00S01]
MELIAGIILAIVSALGYHLAWIIPLAILWFIADTAWFKGWFGEWLVNRALDKNLDPEEYCVLHDITLPYKRGTTQIDHIVISQYGVFVIETKNYSGWIFGSVTQRRWTQTFHRSKFQFQNPLHQNMKHVYAVADVTGVPASMIDSVVIFIGSAKFRTPMPPNVTTGRKGVRYIQRARERKFTPAQVAAMEQAIQRARKERGRKTNKAHVENLKSAKAQPHCPKCNSPLVLRTAKKGAKAGSQFWGCKNFPKCRYTRPA